MPQRVIEQVAQGGNRQCAWRRKLGHIAGRVDLGADRAAGGRVAHREVRHVDEVPGLGAFVEIEAIDLDGSRGEPMLRAQCEEWRARLSIADEDLLAHSYSDTPRRS